MMRHRKYLTLSLLVAVVGVALVGCSTTQKKQYSYLDEVHSVVDKANYPENYQFSETWYGTERGGAALRKPAYEHALISPYAVNDPTGQRYAARDLYTQVLLTSISNTQYANGPRGTFTQAPRFCTENTFLLPNNKQKANRTEYMRIKERYCSTPGYRLTQQEIDILNAGEPEELRQYRINSYIDNQLTKF